ncbi:Aste57867_12144 [Aphanomyces stellatus]|uniref:Aste57867_12144 protein n=1 Tax=Aphanomyces stellatus TaxID=120398 RepID=A0A485KWS8_9STRA|nr:hypothetical protein As57867_012099 [Aphanomyces stellatus]VFT88998.1 Aste57867_12144 [Aphanomyces stellatus]
MATAADDVVEGGGKADLQASVGPHLIDLTDDDEQPMILEGQSASEYTVVDLTKDDEATNTSVIDLTGVDVNDAMDVHGERSNLVEARVAGIAPSTLPATSTKRTQAAVVIPVVVPLRDDESDDGVDGAPWGRRVLPANIPLDDAILPRRQLTSRVFRWAHLPPSAHPRHVPHGFVFPNPSCAIMWQRWFWGDPDGGLGPFRRFTAADFDGDAASQARLEGTSVVMGVFASHAIARAAAATEDDLAALPPRAFDAAFHTSFRHLFPDRDASTEPIASFFPVDSCEPSMPAPSRQPAAKRAPPRPKSATTPPPRITVPSKWKFAPTTCREMWILYFEGDGSIGPYRDVVPNGSKVNTHRFRQAKLVMECLVQLGMEDDADAPVSLSAAVTKVAAMRSSRRASLFDKAFRRFCARTTWTTTEWAGAAMAPTELAYSWLEQWQGGCRRKRMPPRVPDDDDDALRSRPRARHAP